MIKCGECKHFEYRFAFNDGTEITYCKYHQKQYIGRLTKNDYCSKAELRVTKPFNKELCDRKYYASVAADTYCNEDCDMECPYRKE